MSQLKDYGHLIADGELKIKSNNIQKSRYLEFILNPCCKIIILFCYDVAFNYVYMLIILCSIYVVYLLICSYLTYFCRYVFIFDQIVLMCKSARVSNVCIYLLSFKRFI